MCRSPVIRLLAAIGLAVGCLCCGPPAANAEVVNLETDEYATLTGYVYADFNKNGMYDAQEGLIPDVTIILEGVTLQNEPIVRETKTNIMGDYFFKKIPAGTYSVTEVQPYKFLEGVGQKQVGVIPGRPLDDPTLGKANGFNEVVDIQLEADDSAQEYNFSEFTYKSAYVSKRMLLGREPPSGLVPEPGSLVLVVVGLLSCCGLAWRRDPK